jgi:hypothetical protein
MRRERRRANLERFGVGDWSVAATLVAAAIRAFG